MSNDLEVFEEYSEEEESGSLWRVKASTRAMVDIIYRHNLEKEVEALYEIYVIEEKAKWEEWASKFTEKRK
jgi:hypothetical protein